MATLQVMRQGGTELPGTGEYLKCKDKGIYRCAACDAPLYR
jgi:peptide methionine sulfoxide reductase MsrB